MLSHNVRFKYRREYMTIFYACLLTIIMVFNNALFSEANDTHYFFTGKELVKSVNSEGAIKKTILCKDKIDVEKLGISQEILAYFENPDIVVSPDEKFFVFAGRAGRQSEDRYFLVNITGCRVVRELTIDKTDKAYHSFDYRAAFSPDSKKLFVSLRVWNKEDVYAPEREAFWLTKEYSGTGFAAVRTLSNIVIPSTVLNVNKVPYYPYRFSRDGRYLLREAIPKKLPMTAFPGWAVFDIKEDKEIFTMDMERYKEFFGNRKVIAHEVAPDIFNGLLLFSFQFDSGTEVVIFDHGSRKIVGKFSVSEKGTAFFSSNVDRVIVSISPYEKALRKKIMIYERTNGKLLGQAEIALTEEVNDVSDDGQQIILKNGKKMILR